MWRELGRQWMRTCLPLMKMYELFGFTENLLQWYWSEMVFGLEVLVTSMSDTNLMQGTCKGLPDTLLVVISHVPNYVNFLVSNAGANLKQLETTFKILNVVVLVLVIHCSRFYCRIHNLSCRKFTHVKVSHTPGVLHPKICTKHTCTSTSNFWFFRKKILP